MQKYLVEDEDSCQLHLRGQGYDVKIYTGTNPGDEEIDNKMEQKMPTFIQEKRFKKISSKTYLGLEKHFEGRQYHQNQIKPIRQPFQWYLILKMEKVFGEFTANPSYILWNFFR